MKVRITPAIQEELSETICDSLRRQHAGEQDPSDPIYLKIGEALQLNLKPKAITVEADEADIAELKSRALYEVGPNGVCDENIGWSSDFADKAYWLGRKRAYKALLNQLN